MSYPTELTPAQQAAAEFLRDIHAARQGLPAEITPDIRAEARAVVAAVRPLIEAERSPIERIRAATTGPNGEHRYLSTSCWPHEQHEHCRSAINIDGGPKQGGTCKWGPERCICECHQTDTEETR